MSRENLALIKIISGLATIMVLAIWGFTEYAIGKVEENSRRIQKTETRVEGMDVKLDLILEQLKRL